MSAHSLKSISPVTYQIHQVAFDYPNFCTRLKKWGFILIFILARPANTTVVQDVSTPKKSCAALINPHPSAFKFGRVTINVIVPDRFTVQKGIAADELHAAAEAIAVVWSKFSQEPRQFKLTLVPRLAGDFEAECDTQGNITFAVDSIQESGLLKVGLKGIFLFIMYAAHEATHSVQIARGDPPPVSASDPTYPNNRFEFEANDAAMDVLKAFSPSAIGSFTMHGRTYTVPEQSTFKRLTEDLQ